MHTRTLRISLRWRIGMEADRVVDTHIRTYARIRLVAKSDIGSLKLLENLA